MKCFTCGGTMEPAQTTFFSQLKNCILIVKNVPCSKCRQCGEEYFDGNTVDRLEALMQTAENLASELLIIEYNTNAAA
ncbi:type II toxin-antitoxin system MqsA family antitoxin [Eubacterium sp. 1001713B170207_170306_E7]|uniref:type II toxin-antitoxin system MqsA family antitoxin n=1 Tax=Eubacterium sp. 1001713B170207_170306_E7 TaxID=2787097 RepID=UPI00189B882E|nr:type II toxin-antitoxin system MqsA family antitoxin [Eubacterium sp. 1001713B170207_170306_E7]